MCRSTEMFLGWIQSCDSGKSDRTEMLSIIIFFLFDENHLPMIIRFFCRNGYMLFHPFLHGMVPMKVSIHNVPLPQFFFMRI